MCTSASSRFCQRFTCLYNLLQPGDDSWVKRERVAGFISGVFPHMCAHVSGIGNSWGSSRLENNLRCVEALNAVLSWLKMPQLPRCRSLSLSLPSTNIYITKEEQLSRVKLSEMLGKVDLLDSLWLLSNIHTHTHCLLQTAK